MRRRLAYFFLAATSLFAVVFHLCHYTLAHAQTGEAPVHMESFFEFVVAQPYNRVAPLFGANGERAWAGAEWDPQFAYPRPADDRAGAVFTLEHSGHKMYWVTPVFDLKNRHIQHLIVIPDAFVAILDITFPETPPNRTKVHVAYQRTALSPALNQDVKAMSARDAHQSGEWQKAIDQYFASRQKQ